jgi:hypothetical protein
MIHAHDRSRGRQFVVGWHAAGTLEKAPSLDQRASRDIECTARSASETIAELEQTEETRFDWHRRMRSDLIEPANLTRAAINGELGLEPIDQIQDVAGGGVGPRRTPGKDDLKLCRHGPAAKAKQGGRSGGVNHTN